MKKNPSRKERRKHMKGRGDLNKKSTHKMRSKMGMGMMKDSEGGGGSLGSFLRKIITGKED